MRLGGSSIHVCGLIIPQTWFLPLSVLEHQTQEAVNAFITVLDDSWQVHSVAAMTIFFWTFCSPFGNCSRYFQGGNGFHLSFGWQKNAIFVWFTINMTALPAILSNHAKTLKHKYKSLFFLFAVWGKLHFKWTLSVFVTHCQLLSARASLWIIFQFSNRLLFFPPPLHNLGYSFCPKLSWDCHFIIIIFFIQRI